MENFIQIQVQVQVQKKNCNIFVRLEMDFVERDTLSFLYHWM